jgi:endonuclease/exonuclease/phosphatase family metal-dependent hydrolase
MEKRKAWKPMPRWFLPAMLLAAQGAGLAADFQHSIWQGSHARTAPAAKQIKLLSWNIERGLQFQGVEAALVREQAGVLLLQEVDLNARRSGWRDIPEALARRLEMNYAFAAEFLELGQGKPSAPAYHGQAILSAWPLRKPQIIRFKDQTAFWAPRWYLPNWGVFQRRTGGRLALTAEIEAGGRTVVLYNVHLESREAESLRVSQIKEVLAHASQYAAGTPVVLAGDLNVSGPASPVIRAILEGGFRAAVGGEVTTLRGAPLDWIFVRGALHFAEGAILRETRASDHFPLTVRLRIED